MLTWLTSANCVGPLISDHSGGGGGGGGWGGLFGT
jgi:hypothetical protein